MKALEPALILATRDQSGLVSALNRGQSTIDPKGGFRLAMLNPTPERIAKAEKIIAKGKPCHGLQDIWYAPEGLLYSGGKLGFMYPGIDSLSRPDASAVADRFDLSVRSTKGDQTLESRGAEVFYTSDLYTKVLQKLGIKPDLIFGHSLGEWSGIFASGFIDGSTVDSVVETLQPGMLPVPGVVFLALGCSVEVAREAIKGLHRIEVSHDNCPHQSILCGDEASIDAAAERLTHKKIMCQKLDFQSGFHTSMFKDYVDPLAHNINTMQLSTPTIPMWSATTCSPFPSDQAAVRKLLIQHLLEPVRFRELTKALSQEGVRVFVQVGAGSLPGFINDTLRGTPHVCLTTAAPNREGLSQLQRFGFALFVEGANFKIEQLSAESIHFVQEAKASAPVAIPTAPQLLPHTEAPRLVVSTSELSADLMSELEACFADIQAATLEIVQAMKTIQPFEHRILRTLTLKDRPELMDHCLYKQKKGWKNLSDLSPIMPMTATIDLLIDLAQELFEGKKAIGIEGIAATRWLAVEEPKTLEIDVAFDGKNRLKVTIVGHFVGTVIIGDRYPEAPAPKFQALVNARASKISAHRVYDEGWLFHGPAYQSLTAFKAVGDDGIHGTIRASSVPGALLDTVGQIAGIWLMQVTDVDRYAMPIRIRKITFFGPRPAVGNVECDVRVERIRARDIMFNMELSRQDQLWATIDGWEKWRFECDEKFWQFLLAPGSKSLSETKDSFTYFEREILTDTMCDDLARRYLREAERKVYNQLGKKRQSWICGRIAAKDAIRNYLWSNGYRHDIYPAEIWIENDEAGKPIVSELPGDTALSVSISHKEGLGVANVSRRENIGIDVEKIMPRETSFERAAFSAYEMAMIPESDRSEWITRFWGAKEAFAKSTGLGLQGDPRKFAIEEIRPEAIRIQSSWVRSTKLGPYIISQKEG